jgi:hypothetical protein
MMILKCLAVLLFCSGVAAALPDYVYQRPHQARMITNREPFLSLHCYNVADDIVPGAPLRFEVLVLTNTMLDFTNFNVRHDVARALGREYPDLRRIRQPVTLVLAQGTNGCFPVVLTNGIYRASSALPIAGNTNSEAILHFVPDRTGTNLVLMSMVTNISPAMPWAGASAGGGGASCTCSATPAVAETGFGNTGVATAFDSSVHRTGEVWTNSAPATLCSVSFRLTRNGGDISARSFRARVYSMTGNTAVTELGQSAAVLGTNSWSGTKVHFTFATPVSLSAGHYFIGVVADGAVDSANVLNVDYKSTGTLASGWVAYVNSAGVVQNTVQNGADAVVELFFCE